MSEIAFAPRRSIAAWLRDGWRLVPGHEYVPGEWAVLIVLPDIPVELTETQIRSMALRFRSGRAKARSNRACASTSRNHARIISRQASRYISRRTVQELP